MYSVYTKTTLYKWVTCFTQMVANKNGEPNNVKLVSGYIKPFISLMATASGTILTLHAWTLLLFHILWGNVLQDSWHTET